jgi:hypothetical protein
LEHRARGLRSRSTTSSPFFLLSLSHLSPSSLLILSSHLFAHLGSSSTSSRWTPPSWRGQSVRGAASREIGGAQQQHRPSFSSPTSIGLRWHTHRGLSPVSFFPLLFFFSFSCAGLLHGAARRWLWLFKAKRQRDSSSGAGSSKGVTVWAQTPPRQQGHGPTTVGLDLGPTGLDFGLGVFYF